MEKVKKLDFLWIALLVIGIMLLFIGATVYSEPVSCITAEYHGTYIIILGLIFTFVGFVCLLK